MQRKKYIFLFDILTDRTTNRYSMTKFGALIGLILFVVIVIISLLIMIANAEIDHVLVVEVIGFVLTLMGFKNNFGVSTDRSGNKQFSMGSDGSQAPQMYQNSFNNNNVQEQSQEIYQDQSRYNVEENIPDSNENRG